MKEKVLRLGSHGTMVGVLCRASEEQTSDIAVLFLNSGMFPRVGPYRMHVEAGRRLTSLGYDHLRLDQANLGDSRERPTPDDIEERAFLDVGETLDTLQKDYGYRRFVIFGLCAGAYTAIQYAPRDSRVVAVVMLDPPVEATLGFRIRKFLKLFSLRRWRNIFRRRLRLRTKKGVYSPQLANPAAFKISRSLSEKLIREGIDQGKRYLFVQSGTSPFPYNSDKQLGELYPSLLKQHASQVSQIWLPRATHLYSFREDRVKMMEGVENWMKKNF